MIGTATVSLAEWARGYQSANKKMQEVIVKESILERQIKQVPITLRNGSMTYNAFLDVSTVLILPLLFRLIVVVVMIMMFVRTCMSSVYFPQVKFSVSSFYLSVIAYVLPKYSAIVCI